MKTDKKLTAVLACPKCRGPVRQSGMFFVCGRCGLAYPVLQSVPDMLLEDAWKLDNARRNKFTHDIEIS
jgi:uncharacterized protein YbaR (Trm112 family)